MEGKIIKINGIEYAVVEEKKRVYRVRRAIKDTHGYILGHNVTSVRKVRKK